MKLLIVDDEKITRDGLMNRIDWEQLGIDEVTCADDGVHGLETALTFQPDIILSDVRMPRMTGIEMAEKLQALNPDLSIIFMSGYSDKEYLKATIKLKAINYVEKPIDIKEISEAVTEARSSVLETKKAASSKLLSVLQAQSMLAAKLTTSVKEETLLPLINDIDFDFPLDDCTPFFTFLIQFHHSTYTPDALNALIRPVIAQTLSSLRLKTIDSSRQGFLYFYHVWGFKNYTANQKDYLGRALETALSDMSLKYHIVFGENVAGALNLHNSYNSAVIELQNSFFYQNNTHRIYEPHDTSKSFFNLTLLDTNTQLSEALQRRDQVQAEALATSLFQELLSGRNALPNQIKDLYYKLLTTVRDTYRLLQIYSSDAKGADNSIWEHISNCESLYELHELLIEKIQTFFSLANSQSKEHSIIYLIKEFIASHYEDETLSIKDISEHVFLSSSYICTLFKNETGQTLNQYLTHFRMEKAKKLLTDSRYKITDISAKVGYSDGNYFGKTFKKMIGISPSEYREQVINHLPEHKENFAE